MGEPGSPPTGFEFFRRLARRFGVPARDAEDLAQDALLRELEADQRVELGEARAAYGATIVLNLARNHVRNARRRGEVLTPFDDHELHAERPTPEEMLVDWIDVADPAPDAAATMESDSIRTATIDAVNALDPKLRLVLVAHDLNGVSMAQIAEDAGLPLSVVYKQRIKAIGALRDIIGLRENMEDFARRVGPQ
ncbi:MULTISPECIES: RNA polymerase sigma factor [Sorangium]|uniref:RNA polymerase sigma-70 region 2 domain-containing protein n=1 Tax=Sorangium cellulosum TaxID=56 RepID=A0A4P2QTE0_SORCE|nr:MULTISPECIES: sigma-70 family RNA polymerase sigma factor [Sorangium]AUX33617.1 uncharacterized protein SOCE836_057780 [Sorangium cellulosum]WCQ92929.1 hypothetical protein NQZ70_05675 [Sorangium sp. Soce836]